MTTTKYLEQLSPLKKEEDNSKLETKNLNQSVRHLPKED